MKNSFFILFSIVLLFSCSEKKQGNTQEQLMEGVMAVHDEVMPKMGDIMKYKKQISEKNQDAISKLQQVSDDLDASHEQMMNWMHGFNTDFEGMKEEEIFKYLQDEKVKIEQVGQQAESTLKEAIAILQQ